jgi:D-glycero-D-manno-heptose 1,7-bisphosphate phosphatase
VDKVLILDRDGTLILEKNYLHDPAHVELISGVGECLAELAEDGWKFIVLTNQSGVGRGYFTMSEVDSVHQKVDELLHQFGVRIEKYFVAPEAPEQPSTRRKPQIGMLLEAANEFGFAPDQAWVVGDKPADIQLGKNVRANTVLVLTGYGQGSLSQCKPDYVIEDLSKIRAIIGGLS